MGEHPEKEVLSEPSTVLLSVNGVQVWVDNKFDEEVLEENLHTSFDERTDVHSNKIQTTKKKFTE